MDTFLISLAVFIAVILMFRTAVLPYDPSFSRGELLSAEALRYRLNGLGKANGTVERGYGVDCSKTVVRLKRLVRRLSKKDSGMLNDTERVLVDNRDTVLSALNKSVKALGYGYKIGGKKPRIFLLCEQMASHSDCCLTADTIATYVDAFSEHSHLTIAESLLIPHMLRFILCGMILRVVSHSGALEKKRMRGLRDCTDGRVDIDSMRVPEYVCGLYDVADGAQISMLDRLSENGISRNAAEGIADLKRARNYAVVTCAVDSLKNIDSLSLADILDFSPSYRALCTAQDFSLLGVDEKIQVLDTIDRKAIRDRVDEAAIVEDIQRSGVDEFSAENKKKGISRYAIISVAFSLSVLSSVGVYFFADVFALPLAIASNFVFLRCYIALISFAVKVVRRYRPDINTLLSDNQANTDMPHTVKADLFTDFRNYILECVSLCRLFSSCPRQEKADRLFDIFLIFTPIAQFVVLILCSVRFSQLALVILVAPLIADIGICAYYVIVDRSALPFVRPVSAVISLLTIPMNAVFSLGAVVCGCFKIQVNSDGAKLDYKMWAASIQLLSGVTVITVSAVLSGGAVMIALGTLIFIGALVPYLPVIRLRGKASVSKNCEKKISNADCVDDYTYFFGESAYKLNLLRSESVFVTTDNYGKVKLRGMYNNDFATYSFCIRHGKTDLLAASRGVFERGRSVYRCVADGIAICIELISPIDTSALLCRIHAANSTEIDKSIELYCTCKLIEGKSFEYVGMFLDGATDGNDGKTAEHKVDATIQLSVNAFAKTIRTVAVVLGNDKSEIGLSSKILLQLPFSHFVRGSELFCRLRNDDIDTAVLLSGQFDCDAEVAEPTKPSIVVRSDEKDDMVYIRRVKNLRDFGFDFNTVIIGDIDSLDSAIGSGDVFISADADKYLAKRAQKIAVNSPERNTSIDRQLLPISETASEFADFVTEYTAPPLPVADFDIEIRNVGFLPESVLVTNGSDDTVDILCDRRYRSAIYSDGASIMQYDGADILSDDDGLPAVFVVLGENGVLWSPTQKPFCKGDMRQHHCFGYTEYVCAYNGCEVTLKRYLARGKDAEIFDLTVKNTEPTDRVIDAFISASVCMRPYTANVMGETVVVRNKLTGDGFALMASKHARDVCLYREGYYMFGKICCSSGFRDGGKTLAPTLSVKLDISAQKASRAVFCLAKLNGELKISDIDEQTADELFSAEEALWRDRFFVLPRTSERVLDHIYMWALYRVNSFIDDALVSDLYKIGFLYNAVKLTRSDDFEAAIRRVGELGFFDKADYFTAPFDIVPECSQPLLLIFSLKRFMQLKHDNYCLTELFDSCRRALNKAYIDTERALFDIRAYALLYKALTIAIDHFAVGEEKKFCLDKIKTIKSSIERRFDMLASPAHTVDALICVLCGVFYREGSKKLLDIIEKNIFRNNGNADNRVYTLLLFAEACFGVDDNERAYHAVELAIKHGICDMILRADSGSDIVSALLSSIVTERLFGISRSGDEIVLSPHTAANTPHIEYTLNIGDGVKVRIAEGKTDGSWQIKSNGITYVSNRIKIDGKHNDILLQRQVAN